MEDTNINNELSKDDLSEELKNMNIFDSTLNKEGTAVSDFSIIKQAGIDLIINKKTRLTWHNTGSEEIIDYRTALYWIRELNDAEYGGFNNWRLPTVLEALSIVNKGVKIKNGTDIIKHASENIDVFWTCTKSVVEDNRWIILTDQITAREYNKKDFAFVWPVCEGGLKESSEVSTMAELNQYIQTDKMIGDSRILVCSEPDSKDRTLVIKHLTLTRRVLFSSLFNLYIEENSFLRKILNPGQQEHLSDLIEEIFDYSSYDEKEIIRFINGEYFKDLYFKPDEIIANSILPEQFILKTEEIDLENKYVSERIKEYFFSCDRSLDRWDWEYKSPDDQISISFGLKLYGQQNYGPGAHNNARYYDSKGDCSFTHLIKLNDLPGENSVIEETWGV